MTTRPLRSLRAVLAHGVIAAALFAPLTGCESGSFGGLMGSPTAMELLSPMVRDAARSYIRNLEELASSLGNLRDLQGVREFVQRVEPRVNEINDAYQTLASTTGEERANLLKAFGPEIESANDTFLSQADSITENRLWQQVLEPVLEEVSLFR